MKELNNWTIIAFMVFIFVMVLVLRSPRDCPKCEESNRFAVANSNMQLPPCAGSYKVEINTASNLMKSYECSVGVTK